jgi:hypothetical protein
MGRRGEEFKAPSEGWCATAWRLGIRANLRAAPGRSSVRAFPGLAGGQRFSQAVYCPGIFCHGRGWLAGRAFSKSTPGLYDCFILRWNARSSREVLPGSGCRPPRWRFSARHSRDGRRGVPPEALGPAVRDGTWFWASGRSRFPRGFPPASGLKNVCLRSAPWQ